MPGVGFDFPSDVLDVGVDRSLVRLEGHPVDVVEQLRADPELYQLPVVMTSGLNREDEAMEAGADWFLIKPFDPSELVAILQRLLGSE